MLRTPVAHAEMNDAIAFLQRQIDGLKSKEPQCIEELDAAIDSPDVSMEDLLVFDKGQFPLTRELWNTIGPKVDDRDNDDTPNDDDGDDSGDDADSASSTKQSKSKRQLGTQQDETTPTRRKSARRAAASAAAAAAPPPPTKTATQRKKKHHHDHSDG
ncbi:hypothetical protein B5M09_008760 [Aphanomyces astaci]|uniref:Uncharacterized protein n=1 Tax=Aphanomyces astaci TaxID=112090 RepID=A0A425CZC1_APHAT|nr:hypothetical protein B5M09_008760 [Aphanomyces astaci]